MSPGFRRVTFQIAGLLFQLFVPVAEVLQQELGVATLEQRSKRQEIGAADLVRLSLIHI